MTLDDLHDEMLAADFDHTEAPRLALLTHTEALVTLAILEAAAEHADDEGYGAPPPSSAADSAAASPATGRPDPGRDQPARARARHVPPRHPRPPGPLSPAATPAVPAVAAAAASTRGPR
ncbi:hypothetical protein [Streptomyces sp. enrichment culture]|uniref:hypothetical protein n=1 Tax=Streptomyces sp. enrichment culture TaxID=1795815 RepID=UPI003F56586B